MKNIGKFISTRRKELGLTQKELGAKLFVTDKAVSKWERGISIPDTALLSDLANILDVDIDDLLNGEKVAHKKKNISIIIVIILLLVIAFLFLKNISYGYKIQTVAYELGERKIDFGIPKLSFMAKVKDNNFSFKSFRNSSILEKEIKDYLKTLKYSTCNGTIYYYNEEDDYSIIDYSVKNHWLYSTISYSIIDNDYCFDSKVNDYSQKLNGLYKYHLYGDGTLTKSEKNDNKLIIQMIDGNYSYSSKYDFKITMRVYYYKNILEYQKTNKMNVLQYEILEQSYGSYEIVDNKLYYHRDKIINNSDKISIPKTSTFEIKDNGNLVLLDNYLDNYAKNIILK